MAFVGASLALGTALAWGLMRLSDRVPDLPDDGVHRVVCMSPAAAELAFAVGAGDRIVGVSRFTTYPPEAADLPRCGGFFNPNFEVIIGLRPDLILTQGYAARLIVFAGRNGIELVPLRLTDLESIFRELERTGEVLGCREGAERVAAGMRARLEAVRQRVEGRAVRRVVLVTGHEKGALNDIRVVGRGGFLDDLIGVAGGMNVLPDLPKDYATVSKETLVARAPEFVIELQGEGGDHARALAEARNLWHDLLPASTTEVHVITAGYALIPGPRVVEIAERLADILHGEEP